MKQCKMKPLGVGWEGTFWFLPILAAVVVAVLKCDTLKTLSILDGPLVVIMASLVILLGILYAVAVLAGDARMGLSQFHGSGTVAAVAVAVAYRVLGAVPPSVVGMEQLRLVLALAVLWYAVWILTTLARVVTSATGPRQPDGPEPRILENEDPSTS